MRPQSYEIRLSAKEREQLLAQLNRGTQRARVLTRARILLLADEQLTDEEIAETLQVSRGTTFRVRRRYCQEGLEAALHDRPRSGAPPKVTRRLEAHLTALACSQPPEGRARWTLRLLAEKVVELELIDALSYMTVSRLLKKTPSSRG
jgi:putative transposase